MTIRHAALLPVLLLLAALGAAPLAAQTISDPELFAKSAEVTQQALEVWGGYEDPETLARINDIGYRVARHAGYTEMPFTFYLLDMPAPNALALPGGQIFVTRGMLDLGLDDDMLAGLLGHEIAHVALHHHARMQKKATLINLLSQALVVGVVIASANDRQTYDGYPSRPWSPSDPGADEPTRGQIVQGAAAASLVMGELLLRGYSREHEDEADQEGQRWMAAAGFDPVGTHRLMELMSARLPQTKDYGYLQTHPFLDDRAKAAATRGESLTRLEPKDWDDYRQRTQAALTTFLDTRPRGKKELAEPVVEMIEDAALAAWPRGTKAEQIRLARLHQLRDAELAELPVGRDYGAVLRAYEAQRAAVAELTPESELLATLEKEIVELEAGKAKIYPQAAEVLAQGVYETAFLDTFASNWPEAPEIAKVHLALGDAYSRLEQPTEAVTHYLAAWKAAPESEEGGRAREGLRVLTPALAELAALQKLADQEDDGELRQLAAARLAAQVAKFDELRNGAEYLRRFPEAGYAGAVNERLNVLAQRLFNEVSLYRAVGDNLAALERIQEILTHAPTSPAAQQLREQAVLES